MHACVGDRDEEGDSADSLFFFSTILTCFFQSSSPSHVHAPFFKKAKISKFTAQCKFMGKGDGGTEKGKGYAQRMQTGLGRRGFTPVGDQMEKAALLGCAL